jgi:hypothetical protein
MASFNSYVKFPEGICGLLQFIEVYSMFIISWMGEHI